MRSLQAPYLCSWHSSSHPSHRCSEYCRGQMHCSNDSSSRGLTANLSLGGPLASVPDEWFPYTLHAEPICSSGSILASYASVPVPVSQGVYADDVSRLRKGTWARTYPRQLYMLEFLRLCRESMPLLQEPPNHLSSQLYCWGRTTTLETEVADDNGSLAKCRFGLVWWGGSFLDFGEPFWPLGSTICAGDECCNIIERSWTTIRPGVMFYAERFDIRDLFPLLSSTQSACTKHKNNRLCNLSTQGRYNTGRDLGQLKGHCASIVSREGFTIAWKVTGASNRVIYRFERISPALGLGPRLLRG